MSNKNNFFHVKFVMTNHKTLEYYQRSLAKQAKVDFNKVGIKGVRDFFEAKVRKILFLNKYYIKQLNIFFFYRQSI